MVFFTWPWQTVTQKSQTESILCCCKWRFTGLSVAMHTYNPNTQEGWGRKIVSLRIAQVTEQDIIKQQ